jgi:LysM repeat protein
MRWKVFLASAVLGSLMFQVLPTEAEPGGALAVPFATQFDGSPFAATDCGPASVAMAINYATSEHLTPLQARQAIIKLPGGGYAANPSSGTAIQDLVRIARAHQLEVFPGDGGASTGWGPERIRSHLGQGHTVIVLTRLASLPGYSATSQVDHYIILIGATSSGYVYHDPGQSNGGKRTISEKQLQLAQRSAGVPGQGAAFAGPAGTQPGSPTTELEGPVTHVTVQRGDTLSELADRYGVELKQVLTLNRSLIKNINHIEVGQILVLPVEAPPTR